jgi:uncharacterized protein YbaR (Trm112 family)
MFATAENQQFVVKQLNSYLGNAVERYNLLYRSKTGGNIDECLEGHPNTVLLMLTKEGHTVAGFSSLSYCETRNTLKTKGLLICTHANKAYPLK